VWLGHPLTAYKLYPCRKLTFINPHGTRNVGRLPVEWIDTDEEDGKKVELTTGKRRQRTEWSGVASLWPSWLGWGCSTSTNKWIGRYTAWFKRIDSISYVHISRTIYDIWMIYITFERGGHTFSNTTARALAQSTAVQQRQLRTKWLLCNTCKQSFAA
jgi:hypothetical protein